MASSWFFILLLKCIDFLSWPVLALGYPLFASIEAIESESHSETRNLISYWILLSLIYLFEYAFLSLLQWFKYWNYMKLIMVFFLVMPDFRRSGYVYNHLIKSCIYVNPQAVISRLRDWKNIFAHKEDFIMQAEKCISQNGTEAVEKLLASKNTEQSFHAETRMTPEKNETNIERPVMEQKDIKDLEMIEKEQVPEFKQFLTLQADNSASDSLKSHESTSSAMAETEKMTTEIEEHDGTYPQICATENVQKEWTCAICQMTMPSEANLNCHLQGRRHKAACEALNTKNKAMPAKDAGITSSSQGSAAQNVQNLWKCGICQSTIYSLPHLNSHMRGRKHKAACEALNMKTEVAEVADTGNGALPQLNGYQGSEELSKGKRCLVVKLFTTQVSSAAEALNTKKKAMPAKDVGIGLSSQGSAAQNVQDLWKCGICQSTIYSLPHLNSHVQGRKHKAACEALNMKTKVAKVADTGNGALPQIKWNCDICQMRRLSESNFQSHLQGKKHKAACEEWSTKIELFSELFSEDVQMKKNDNESIIKEQEKDFVDDAKNKVPKMKKVVHSCRFRCDMCNVNCTSEVDLGSHLQGKKHVAQIQLLRGWS